MAESTRPGGGVYGGGARTVPPEEEADRLLPVLEALRKATDAPISVDTRKGDVACQALAAGADLINDVSALGDPALARTVRGVVRGSSIYLVPRDDGRVVVGATVQERGWDERPTAGGAYGLLRDALALVPGLDDAELVAVMAGLRPGSPDDLPLIGPEASLADAVLKMTEKRLGCVGVVADGRLIGIITDGDLRRQMRPDLLSATVDEIMTRKCELLMQHFGTQRGKSWFDPETFRALARLRGVECRARYAEAFWMRKMVLR